MEEILQMLNDMKAQMNDMKSNIEDTNAQFQQIGDWKKAIESQIAAGNTGDTERAEAAAALTPPVPTEVSTPDIDRKLEMLHVRMETFAYNIENGDTFDAWFARYKDLVELDAATVPDSAKARVLVAKLATPMHQQFIQHILPKVPKDLNLKQTIDTLTLLFGKKKSVFRMRYECLQLCKSSLDDYLKHTSIVNAACEEFGVSTITPDQFKCLMFLCSLKSHEDEVIRTRILRAIDSKENMTLTDIVKEIERFNDLQTNNRLIGEQDTVVNRVFDKKYNRSTKEYDKKSFDKCKYCGGRPHKVEECKARTATCRKCEKKGHFASVCKKPTGRSTNMVQANTSTATFSQRHGRRFVNLVVKGRKVRLLLDTGSDITLISEATWKKLGQPSLSSPDVRATAANGEALKINGSFECEASYQDEEARGVLFVTDKLDLLGTDWLNRFPTFRSMLDAVCNKVTRDSSIISSTSSKAVVPQLESNLLKRLKEQYADVFTSTLGLCKMAKARLQLKKGAVPVFKPKRQVSINVKETVDIEIDRLEQKGVIEKVIHTNWAAPIVGIRKADGKIRVCADFSTGLNDALEDYVHPLPTADEIFSTLNGGEVFSTIDFKDAYLQIELEKDSQDLLVINTHRGLYRYTRLPFGVKTAPAIFQQIMDTMLAGVDGCCAYLDDVIVSGKNIQEHNKNLEACLKRVSEFGFHVNFEKCSFIQPKIRYLGMIISKEGRTPDPLKIEAIKDMPAPQDVSQLRSFVGCINYYGSFLKNLHELRAPMDKLLRNDVKWNWNKECQSAFEKIKEKLMSPLLLTHYDPKREIVLVTDASQYGLGAAILHRYPDKSQKAVEHASRTLSPAEKNYGQIEKEGLAIFWALKKFYRYLMGRKFTIVTDHKPLVSIYGSKKGIPVVTANRLQRWGTYMLGFDFKIEFKPTNEMGCADVLSRLIPQNRKQTEDVVICAIEQESAFGAEFRHTIATLPLTSNMICEATKKDVLLQAVIKAHQSGVWPNSRNKEMTQFYNRKSTLAMMNDILLSSERIVIPTMLKGKVLKQLHQGHQGVVRTKRLARSMVFWPGIDADIEEIVKGCASCQRAAKSPVKTSLESWSKAEKAWERVHADFAGPMDGRYYLIIVDAYSKWQEIIALDRITTNSTVVALTKVFSQFGMPETLVTDNGTQFTSAEFALFCARNGIEHVRSPPFHPQSNGQAERFVDTFKRSLLKLKGEGTPAENLQTFLLTYRQTPSSTVTGNCSPAEAFLGRRLRTSLDLMKTKPERIILKDKNMEKQYDKHHGSRDKSFQPGDLVYARDFTRPAKPTWIEGKIVKRLGQVLYDVEITGKRRIVRRHANQLFLRIVKGRTSAYDILLDAFELTEPCMNTVVPPMNNLNQEVPSVDEPEIPEEDPQPVLDVMDPPEEDAEDGQAAAPEVAAVAPSTRRSSRTVRPPNKLDVNPKKKTYRGK